MLKAAPRYRIFDAHHHVGTMDALLGGYDGLVDRDLAPEHDADRRIARMDRDGVEQALLMPAPGQPAPRGIDDTRRQNDELARYRDQHPDRFPAALGTVGPLDGVAAAVEIDRCITVLGMKGIVWHHRFQGTFIDHQSMHPLLDRVRSYGVPAFVHVVAESTMESPWRLEVLADRYPEIQFVALDGFSTAHHASWMNHIAKKYPNITFDTGVLASVGHMLEEFVASVGAHRLLYGSDFYATPTLFNTPFALNEVLASGLGDEEKMQILGGNARRLLRLE